MKKIMLMLMAFAMAVAGCRNADAVRPVDQGEKGGEQMTEVQSGRYDVATFAGGCFWCTESDFEKIPGVIRVVSGYTGGRTENPTYEEVCSGDTGHYEAVQVYFDPAKVSYASLVEVFWRHVDPTDAGGQFVDRGTQYRTAIFAGNGEQQRIAEESRDALNRSGKLKKPVATQILPLKVFYVAEDYHQDYYKTCSLQYAAYRVGSGRDRALEGIWGKMPEKTAAGNVFRKPDAASLRKTLTPLQYHVTQEEGTEPPFRNTYWDNKEEGIYVDVVSGEPLFSSRDKYDSGTGWPSFTKPLEGGNIVTREDRRLFATRTEVRSRHADSHLGHVFPDGPEPTGLRYCMNSAALRFIPKKDLEKEGYGVYRKLFENVR